MIAPIRDTRAQADLAGARRAVADMLFQGSPRVRQTLAERRVSKRASWMLVAWAAAVALIYLFRGSR